MISERAILAAAAGLAAVGLLSLGVAVTYDTSASTPVTTLSTISPTSVPVTLAGTTTTTPPFTTTTLRSTTTTPASTTALPKSTAVPTAGDTTTTSSGCESPRYIVLELRLKGIGGPPIDLPNSRCGQQVVTIGRLTLTASTYGRQVACEFLKKYPNLIVLDATTGFAVKPEC